jgi:O-antigen/teichoic acid export membrane protein
MRSLFLKNLFLLQGLNLVVKPIWILLIDRMANNLLGTAYGEYYIVLNLSLVFGVLLDIGIQSFNNTHVASDPLFFKKNLKTLVSLKLILSLLYFGIVFTLGWVKQVNVSLLMIVAASQIVTSFILYFRSNINGLHHYKIDSFLSVSDKFFGIILCVLLYWFQWINVYYFASAQLLALCFTLLIAMLYNIKFYAQIEAMSYKVNTTEVKLLIRKSLPFALLFALMGLYTRVDVVLMNILLDNPNYYSSLYAQSYRFLDASSMFAMLFAGLLLPMFAKLLANNEDVKPLTKTATTILLLTALVVGLGSMFYNERIMKMMYDYADVSVWQYSSQTFKIIMLSFIPMALIFVFSTLLTAQKDIYYLILFAATALIVNLLLNFILIPKHNIIGAAVATLVTQSVFALLCLFRCFHLYHFKLSFSLVMRYLLFIICLFGVFFFVKAIGNTILSLGLFVIFSVLLSILLKLINPHTFVNFLKNKAQ